MSSSATPTFEDRGPATAPPPKALPPLRLSDRLAIWIVLQAGGALTLAVSALLLLALAPLFRGDRAFLRQWGTAFLVVPLTFVPVLARWHAWALKRYGKRGGFFRLVAEVAFAGELIGCVLMQRIA